MCLRVREIQGQNRTAPLMKKSKTSLLADDGRLRDDPISHTIQR
jgi:hypothetical protein